MRTILTVAILSAAFASMAMAEEFKVGETGLVLRAEEVVARNPSPLSWKPYTRDRRRLRYDDHCMLSPYGTYTILVELLRSEFALLF